MVVSYRVCLLFTLLFTSQLTTSRQTSLRSGLLQGMGKGFLAAHGLLGQDLGDLIQDACSRRGLNVQLNAIVNDSSATLLSKATTISTVVFMLTSISLSILATKNAGLSTGPGLQRHPTTTSAPATPTPKK